MYRISETSVRLQWTDNSINETGFRIDRKIGDEGWVANYGNIGPDNEMYIDNNCNESALYDYRISSIKDEDISTYCEAEILIVGVPSGYVVVNETNYQSGNSPTPSLVKCFMICDHEVTQGEYNSITNSNEFEGENNNMPAYWYSSYPNHSVTAEKILSFCNDKSSQEGLEPYYVLYGSAVAYNENSNGYRLPTEHEWNIAAAGGHMSENYVYSGSDNIDDVAWYEGNTDSIQNIKLKNPNELGIYDMSGNVKEALERDDYTIFSKGGCYNSNSEECKISSPTDSNYSSAYRNVGIRLVRSLN